MVIKGQEMGCPCPEFKILSGELVLPDSITRKYKNLYKEEINLTSNSLLQSYNYEVYHQDIYVSGELVDVEQLPENANVPVFEVQKWKIKKYLPQLLIWNKVLLVIYLIVMGIGLGYYLFRGGRYVLKEVK
ncbi:hypothetical protein OO013_15700 [Mangrovivirga sp. M17]|uniref:Uncharacterized protein n=1 Tax=Mangrovivirga halotolerans TaxID=2993936 RepID=A0ABT3RU61_9BACT|nr:hypothetical protein [Mangrovivirga halotolerans]MCX2745322.1 hypothetical protein [Mangrovivirga halotolerans]